MFYDQNRGLENRLNQIASGSDHQHEIDGFVEVHSAQQVRSVEHHRNDT